MSGLKNKKSKLTQKNRKTPLKLVIIPLIFILLIPGLYLLKSLVRTASPKVTEIFYGRNIQNIFDDELDKLQDPLNALGYKNIDKTPVECMLGRVNGSTAIEIICNVRWSSYQVVSQDTNSKVELNKSTNNIQNLLKQNSWDGEYSEDSEYTSLKKLMQSITSGIDYQPDAAYQKVIGKMYCIFDSNTAFSSPNPPAIASSIDCSQSFYPFGQPDIHDPLQLAPEARG